MPFAAAYKITAWNQENQKMNMAKEKVFAVIMLAEKGKDCGRRVQGDHNYPNAYWHGLNSCVIPGKIIRFRSENK